MKFKRFSAMLLAGVIVFSSLPFNSARIYAAETDSIDESQDTIEIEDTDDLDDPLFISEEECEPGVYEEPENDDIRPEGDDTDGITVEDLEPGDIVPDGAEVERGSCGIYATWSLDDDGTLTISGTGGMYDYTSTDKPEWNGHSADITKVKIGEGITSVGNTAFFQYSNITSVELPSTLLSIGNYAFYQNDIRSIQLPANLHTIGQNAFSNNRNLRNLTLPEGLKTIDKHAFLGCSNLSNLRLESRQLGSCGDSIFAQCRLSTVDFATDKSDIRSIPAFLFNDAGFDVGTTVTIPATVTSIGKYAFRHSDPSYPIADGFQVRFDPDIRLTNIGNSAFYMCHMDSVTLPSSVQIIEENAFAHNDFTAITIPANVHTIGSDAFSYCPGLTSVRLETRKLTSLPFYSPFSNCNIGTIDFASDLATPLTTIPSDLFHETDSGKGITDGTVITIPASVETIGDRAFYGSFNIKLEFEEGSNLTTIGTNAFSRCQIEEINLPESLVNIGSYAFSNNDRIRSLTIPSKVQRIGYAFEECSNLTSLTIESGRISECDRAFENCPIKTLVLGRNMKNIPKGLFRGVKFNENCWIVIPDNITRIEDGNFWYGTYMSDITIPATVTYIGNNVFETKPCNTVFHVVEGSYAYNWAMEKGFTIATTRSVKYYLNGGTNNAGNPVTTETGDNLVLLEPTRTGYRFDGWFLDAAFTDGPVTDYMDDGTTVPAFYAKWTAIDYNLTLDLNGEGAQLPPGATSELYVKYDAVYPVLPTPTRPGYAFAGWFTQATGGIQIVAGKTKMLSEGATAYARWTPNTYTVKFHSNLSKDTTKTQAMTYGQVTELAANTFKDTGKSFVKWTTAKDGTGNSYIDKAHVSNLTTENKGIVDLYAQWATVDYFVFLDSGTSLDEAGHAEDGSLEIGGRDMLSFDLETIGLADPDPDHKKGYIQAMTYGEEIELTGDEFVRRGYTLTGWKNSKTGKIIKSGTVSNLTAAQEIVTMTAQWSLDSYTVKYNLNGGKMVGKGVTKYNVNDTVQPVPQATRTGYELEGWYDNKDLTGVKITDIGGPDNELRNLVLYANWTPITYWVDRNANIKGDATDEIKSDEVSYDEKFVLNKNEFSRPGYTLSSWNLQRDGKGKKVGVSATLKNAAGKNERYTLYGQWTPNTYKVTYDLQGGKQSGAPSSYKPDNGVDLKIPVKTGYTFTGWTLEMKDGSDPETAALGNTATPATVPEKIAAGSYGDVVLTAGWSENYYKVNYHMNAADGMTAPEDSDYVYTAFYKYTSEQINLTVPAKELEEKLTNPETGSVVAFTTKPSGGTSYALTKVLSKLKPGAATKEEIDASNTYDMYAKWGGKSYYITYDYIYETGEGEDPAEFSSKEVTFKNAPVTYVSDKGTTIPSPSKAGYIFEGWSSDKATVQLSVSNKGAWSIDTGSTGDVKLTAEFKPIEYDVTVFCNGTGVKFNDGSAFSEKSVKSSSYYANEDFPYTYGVSGDLPGNIFALTRPGYLFDGYNTQANGKGTRVEPDAIENLTSKDKSNVNIYAQWIAKEYDVTYTYAVRTGGVDEVLDSDELVNKNPAVYTYAKAIKLTNPVLAGYTFAGWELTSDGNETTKNAKGFVTQINAANDADVSLKGVFTENMYKISINSNGGINTDTGKSGTISVATGVLYTTELGDIDSENLTGADLMSEFWTKYTKKGYEFAGFATDKNGKNMVALTSSGLTDKNNATVTLYAIWNKVEAARPSAVSLTSSETGKVTVSFNGGNEAAGIDGVSGVWYEIEYSTGLIFRNDRTRLIDTRTLDPTINGGEVTVTITGNGTYPLTSGERYFVRIRECRTDSQDNTVYSAWSLVKGVRVHD